MDLMNFDIGEFSGKLSSNFNFSSEWKVLMTTLHGNVHAVLCLCGASLAKCL
jgi:hypothetical protein